MALIQGNIPQDVKVESEPFRQQTVDIYERLTREAAKGGVDLIVWPESAVPFFFQDEPAPGGTDQEPGPGDERTACSSAAPPMNCAMVKALFSTAPFMCRRTARQSAGATKCIWSPLANTCRWEAFLTFISKLVVGIGDFSPGERAVTTGYGQHEARRTMVCYEVIFPELARQYVQRRCPRPGGNHQRRLVRPVIGPLSAPVHRRPSAQWRPAPR